MKKFPFLFFIFGCFKLFSVADTLLILNTTDIHGQLLPFDYYHEKPAENGLAKIHSRVKQYRDQFPKLLLLDCGDVFEGSLFDSYYFNNYQNPSHPYIEALNLMDYDALTVGNHDVEIGKTYFDNCRQNAKFPWLAANSHLTSQEPYFTPFVIKEINHVKIGILGISTPSLNRLQHADLPEINWLEIDETMNIYLPQIRPRVDILIGLFHFGLEQLSAFPELTRDFDVILGGHVHRTYPALNDTITSVSEPIKLMAGSHAKTLGVLKIVYEKNAAGIEILEKSAWNEAIKKEKPSAEILALTDIHEAKKKFMNQFVTMCNDTIKTQTARFRDNALIEMINRAQMEFTGCDFSFTSCFDTSISFEPGPVFYRDILALYQYTNKICVIELTGQQIQQYLEICAGYFEWNEGKLQTNPKMKAYNYDIAEGLDYIIDVSKPKGQRIVQLVQSRNHLPLDEKRIYKIALNSYRATGGGGFLKQIGAHKDNVISFSELTIPEILVNYFSRKKTLNNQCDSNWRILQFEE